MFAEFSRLISKTRRELSLRRTEIFWGGFALNKPLPLHHSSLGTTTLAEAGTLLTTRPLKSCIRYYLLVLSTALL